MSKKSKIILGVIVLAIALLAGGAYFASENAGLQVEQASVSKQPLAISVMASGKVTAGESQDVYPSSQGVISEMYVEEGDVVAKGDDLAKIDTDPLDAQLKQAQAALKQAQAGLKQAQGQTSAKSSGLTAAKAGVSAAQVGYDTAKTVRAIASSTFASAKTTLASIDPLTSAAAYATAKGALAQAEIAYEQANAGVAQAKAGLAQAKSGLKQAQSADVASAKSAASAGVAAAQEGVDLAQEALVKATLQAPKDGTVLFASGASAAMAAQGASGASKLDVGSAVMPGSSVFTIIDKTAMSFTAEVDEADVTKIKLGQTANVTLDAFNGDTFTATVIKVGTTAQSTLTGGTVFPIELAIDASGKDIKLGMKGDCVVEIEVMQGALTVPIEALFSEGGKDHVFAIGADNKLKKTEVVVGTTTDTTVEILQGVTEDLKVALAGKTPLMDGSKVTVITSKK